MSDKSIVILFKDSKREEVFLVYRSDYPVWGLTGGGIEQRETPEETAIREAVEETGFTVRIIKKIGIYETKKSLAHFYEGRVTKGRFKPEFPGCEGSWFKINQLPKDTLRQTREKILDAVNYKGETPFTKKLKEELVSKNIILAFRHPGYLVKYLLKR